MLYIADIQRFAINSIGGGKCIESHKVIKKVEYKDKEKVWEKEEGISLVVYRICYIFYRGSVL